MLIDKRLVKKLQNHGRLLSDFAALSLVAHSRKVIAALDVVIQERTVGDVNPQCNWRRSQNTWSSFILHLRGSDTFTLKTGGVLLLLGETPTDTNADTAGIVNKLSPEPPVNHWRHCLD